MTHTDTVLRYTEVMAGLVPTISSASDWEPLVEFVAVDGFGRTGTFMEVQDWAEYTVMLTGWAGSIDAFEASVRRIAEVDDRVYYEIEERHTRGGEVHVVNSMTVFEFEDTGRICHLDVYLQQRDS